MKKTIIAMMLAVLGVGTSMADNTFTYGYKAEGITLQDTLVAGIIKTATISGFSNSKHSGTHYALLYMPKTETNTMAGCKITNIGFFPFITSQTTAKLVISNEIGGTPIYEQEVTGVESQKWHDIALSTPFCISADQDLYIGYTIESATGDYPIGYYYTSNPAQQAKIDPVLDYIAYEYNGELKTGMLDTEMYKARRQTANLMLYATIASADGTELPANAVAIEKIELKNGMYIHPDSTQAITCYFNNTGVDSLRSYRATVKDGENIISQKTVTRTTALAPMEEGSFTLSMVPNHDTVGLHKMTFTIDQPNGQANAFKGNESMTKGFLAYNDSVKRNVVLEHFTTGQCINCVSGEELVETQLWDVDPSVNVIRINHHSGYQTDKLTTTEDEEYVWLYGGTYVWAPANMIDRTDLAAYGAKGYGGTSTAGPVFGTDKSASMASLITSASNIPSFVTLNADASVSGSKLTINVKASELYEMPQQDLMRLNVVIVEDSVKAAQMLSDNTVDKNFIHYNVFRKCLTGTWGETPVFNDKSMEKTFTYDIPSSWKAEKLRVVAFLADYDSTSTKNCAIYNAVETNVKVITEAGIHEIENDKLATSKYYNIAGQLVNGNTKGLVICNGRKIINK